MGKNGPNMGQNGTKWVQMGPKWTQMGPNRPGTPIGMSLTLAGGKGFQDVAGTPGLIYVIEENTRLFVSTCHHVACTLDSTKAPKIPKEAKKLHVNGAQAEAWMYQSKLYLRTPLTLISPGWTSKLAGSDGTIFVYEVSDPVSKIILLDGGKMKHATLEGI